MQSQKGTTNRKIFKFAFLLLYINMWPYMQIVYLYITLVFMFVGLNILFDTEIADSDKTIGHTSMRWPYDHIEAWSVSGGFITVFFLDVAYITYVTSLIQLLT